MKKYKICERCHLKFTPSPRNPNRQMYCGSITYKTGCSWIMKRLYKLNWQKEWIKNADNKKHHRLISRIYMRIKQNVKNPRINV